MSGQLDLSSLHICDVCNGTGRTWSRRLKAYVRCSVCGGSGTLNYNPAPVIATGDPFAGMEKQQ